MYSNKKCTTGFACDVKFSRFEQVEGIKLLPQVMVGKDSLVCVCVESLGIHSENMLVESMLPTILY